MTEGVPEADWKVFREIREEARHGSAPEPSKKSLASARNLLGVRTTDIATWFNSCASGTASWRARSTT